MARRWSADERQALWNGVGSFSLDWLRKHSGMSYPNTRRSRESVYAAIRRHLGPGGLRRGAWTLRQLCVETGYEREHLLRAAHALRQRWQRIGPRGAFLISHEQMEELVAWLVHDYWDVRRRLYGCAWCSTMTRPPRALGLCSRCYYRYRNLCRNQGLPLALSAQTRVATRITCPKGTTHGRVLTEIRARLRAKVALTERHIEWLVCLGDPDVQVGPDGEREGVADPRSARRVGG